MKKQILSIITIAMLMSTGIMEIISNESEAAQSGPPNPPEERHKGDIIVMNGIEGYWKVGEFVGGWNHAACYIGEENGVEKVVQCWHPNGKVQITTLDAIYDALEGIPNAKIAWLRVKDPDTGEDLDEGLREAAAEWMKTKVGRPFDSWSPRHCLLSPTRTKQIDEYDGPYFLGYRYYCSEIVWAGYAQEGVGVDIDTNAWEDAVFPHEIYDSDNTRTLQEWHNA
jgi:uncharacterized protein YycO